jgi:hypothetical protein
MKNTFHMDTNGHNGEQFEKEGTVNNILECLEYYVEWYLRFFYIGSVTFERQKAFINNKKTEENKVTGTCEN